MMTTALPCLFGAGCGSPRKRRRMGREALSSHEVLKISELGGCEPVTCMVRLKLLRMYLPRYGCIRPLDGGC